MADPEHVPKLDDFDETTVRLYRAGLGISACMILLAAIVLVGTSGGESSHSELVRGWLRLTWIGVAYGTGASVANMHLYDRKIRWALHGSAWLGVMLMMTGLAMSRADIAWWVLHMGLGFLFVVQSGLALKEQFCFRLPLLRAVPALLCVGVFALAFELSLLAGGVLLAAGGLLLSMVLAKMRMPLHYDIGDKSKYQI